jgi:hypothetical protein
MIVPIFGSPGCGKTTLGNALMKKFGYPFFELSWMPELKVMNSKKISYEQEEKIAIFALLNVAKTYCEHGHQVVLISDFRFDSFDLVMQNIGLGSPVIKLISSDENVLRSRVLDNSRPSAYRNANEALDLNKKMLLRTFENQLTIDVSKYDLETEINLISNFFIALTNK